jgi:hypothetical protein
MWLRSVEVASPACPVLDSYRPAVELVSGPYVSQYASSSLTQFGRLMAPASQRLTFGCEAAAIPNSVRRIWAHVRMSCPACARAARSRSRWTSPQATSASGFLDTRIVSHTHNQGYTHLSTFHYHTYVAYTAMPTVPSLDFDDGSLPTPDVTRARVRKPPGPLPASGDRMPTSRCRRLTWNYASRGPTLPIADHTGRRTLPRVNRIQCESSVGRPSRIPAVKFVIGTSTGAHVFPQDISRVMPAQREPLFTG